MMGTWAFGYLGIWAFGHLGIWAFGHLDMSGWSWLIPGDDDYEADCWWCTLTMMMMILVWLHGKGWWAGMELIDSCVTDSGEPSLRFWWAHTIRYSVHMMAMGEPGLVVSDAKWKCLLLTTTSRRRGPYSSCWGPQNHRLDSGVHIRSQLANRIGGINSVNFRPSWSLIYLTKPLKSDQEFFCDYSTS